MMDIPLSSSTPDEQPRKSKMRRRVVVLVFAATVLIVDQLTKSWIESTLEVGQFISLSSFFNIVHALNTGAAFSFLADEPGWQRWFFIALGTCISLALVISLMLQPFQRDGITLALLVGGAMGNVTDRVTRGAVVDWLDFYLYQWHWPAFNIADVAIVTAAALLCLHAATSHKTES